MDQADRIVARAREWAVADTRVRAALVHGSVARNETTELSDVDLVVVAEPGRRGEIWAEREEVTRRLLGADPVASWEVPHQRPYRWQARTAELDMLDLTLDEGTVDVWIGLTGEVDFLVDRGDVRAAFEQDRAHLPLPEYDATGACDVTWGLLVWLAGGLLQRRVFMTWVGICDLIASRLVPLLAPPAYRIGSVGDPRDQATLTRLDEVCPRSSAPEELARALHAAGVWYTELLTDWAERTGRARPGSGLEAGTMAMLARLARGELGAGRT
ncbi:MAG TPA: nucleotidyltransferase domain-containing protein [Nocardioides sp.]|uniref:nucleotidyltransferase domain-containing protein n=1 Tax=Nocardioides sp. TaxID=35761 RepID=UPI002F3F8BB3